MNTVRIVLLCTTLAWLPLRMIHAQSPVLKTAKNHPMQYYMSVPKSWTPTSKLGVIILFEAADKLYKENIERFIMARGEAPFIIVQPIHTNNGNQGRREPTLFPYTTETWDYIDKVGDCQFNSDGINAIYNEIRSEYHTQDRWYATGFEAGTHMLWWMIFNQPERVRVAAAVAGNYRARCVDENKVAYDPKSPVIIKAFFGDQDELARPGGVLYDQWVQARDLAKKKGYTDVSDKSIPGKGHVTMEKEVMEFFSTFVSK